MYYRVLVASQRFHGKEDLTYQGPADLKLGQLVRVPLQRQVVVGIVTKKTVKPSFATKPITEILPIYLPVESLQLLEWLRVYYPAPLGLLTELFTPPSLPKKIELPSDQDRHTPPTSIQKDTLPTQTKQQALAIETITSSSSNSFLLHGDTGTGKTRLYLELAREALAQSRSVIILTPEIGLTRPLQATFEAVFSEQVIVTHSEMTPAQRRRVWLTLASSDQPRIIIGPRSALFAPVSHVGLIVMDEAHDSAYKQERAPYYQTSRVAAQLAHLHKARFIMGSATPLISDYYMFEQKQLPIIRMDQLATTQSPGDNVGVKTHIIDKRERDAFSKSPWLANSLLAAMQTALVHGEQSLLFLNRRGSARLVLCERCGWQAYCPHCDVPLTYHQDKHIMRCHSCDFNGAVPSSCPECGAGELIFRAIGTKALADTVSNLFPEARVARFDRDTAREDRLQHQFEALQAGDIDIVVGTQSVVKGFDLPKLSVVGVIQADSGLQMPDYSASERTFQLLSQVSGRIGRGHRSGQLFVQTFDPDSQLIADALAKDYQGFYRRELNERQQFQFPPYYYIAKLTVVRASSRSAWQVADTVAASLRTQPGIKVEGPTPRFIEKIAGKYAWHIIIKAKQRSNLLACLEQLPSGVQYDLDPSDLL